MATWQQIPQVMPPNGVEVWVRILPNGRAPFLAVYDEGQQVFSESGTGLLFPWYFALQWREV